jgi:hypothetical protein
LVNRLNKAEVTGKSDKQHSDLVARETPQWNSALNSFRRRVAIYDFARAADTLRKVKLTDSSLKQQQSYYQNVAGWLVEWKATLISDLKARGYNGPVVINKTQYSGIAGASADKLKIKVPYGVAETDWSKVPAATLVTVSSFFAMDADRVWRCGVFAWATGQSDAARRLFDDACSANASYKQRRKFFDETKP